MRRLHLFEIHDFDWCPRVLRDGLTDFLATSIETFDSYGPIRTPLMKALEESRASRVVDLCSGGGGPWKSWSQMTPNLPPIILTDKFPNEKARVSETNSYLVYNSEPVDATAVPEHLTGFRTIFTAAHHFQPETIRKVIEDAVRQRQPIAIFELTHRSLKGLAFVSLSAIGVWLLTPRIRGVSMARLFFTYIVPVIPFMAAFDGIVSCLRTYTPDELSGMANAPGYKWQIGTQPGSAMPITYLIGIPEEPRSV